MSWSLNFELVGAVNHKARSRKPMSLLPTKKYLCHLCSKQLEEPWAGVQQAPNLSAEVWLKNLSELQLPQCKLHPTECSLHPKVHCYIVVNVLCVQNKCEVDWTTYRWMQNTLSNRRAKHVEKTTTLSWVESAFSCSLVLATCRNVFSSRLASEMVKWGLDHGGRCPKRQLYL